MTRPDLWTIGRWSLVALGLAVVLGTHATLTGIYLETSNMGADEGFYALAARKALDGEIPYRDFGYTQMPLLPYLNGLAMEIAGYGMTEQRAINIAWSFVALLAVVLALRQRFGSFEPGLVAAWCVAASPHWAEMMSIGTSHGSASMAMALSAAAVLTGWSPVRRAALLAVFGTLAVGIRLSCAPMVAVLALVPVVEAESWRRRLLAAALPLVVALVALGPFLLAAPEAMLFNVWDYHLASVFDRRGLHQAMEWWRISPAGHLVLVAGAVALPHLLRRRLWSEALLIGAGLAGVTLPMISESAYGVYITPAALVAATAGINAFWKSGHARGNPFRHVIWLLPALVLYHPLPKQVARGDNSIEVEEIGEYLRERVPPGPILTPVPIVAVESGREVVRGTEMGMFAAMRPDREKIAPRLGYTTLPELTRIVERREPAALVMMKGGSRWNFKWRIPTLRRQPRKAYALFRRAVSESYRTVHRGRRMEVLLPRDGVE